MKLRWPNYRWALIAAVSAQIAAAALVLYLQLAVAKQQRSERSAVLQHLCAKTMTDVSARVRTHLDGAMREVVERVIVDELRQQDYDLGRAATELGKGLEKFSYVDYFFLWSEQFPPEYRDQVLFVTRNEALGSEQSSTSADAHLGTLVSIPDFGRQLFAIAKGFSDKSSSYTMFDREVDRQPYEVTWRFLRRTRQDFYAMAGHIVNVQRARESLFDGLMRTELAEVLNPDPTVARLNLTVRDEEGRIVSHDRGPTAAPCATAMVDFRFFPDAALGRYLVTPVSPRMWTLSINASAPSTAWSVTEYWASGMAVMFILAALLAAVASVRQAQELARIQADFVTNVSHQLKTPLSVLSGASQTLHSKRLQTPEKLAAYNEVVRGQISRLSRLVDQILTFAKTDAGLPSSRQRVEMNELVRRSVVDFQSGAASKDVLIGLELATGPLIVHGDPASLEQVIVNLLDNAVKYGRNDAANEVVVRVEAQGQSVVVSVLDRGVGIDPSEASRIFTKFYRGRNVQSRTRGFGLGLAIVQAVVSAHNGRVSVRTPIGGGSEFRIVLPTV